MNYYADRLESNLVGLSSKRERERALYELVLDLVEERGPLLVPWVAEALVDVTMYPVQGYGNRKQELKRWGQKRKDACERLITDLSKRRTLEGRTMDVVTITKALSEIYPSTFHHLFIENEGKEKANWRTKVLYLDRERGIDFVRSASYQDELEHWEKVRKASYIISRRKAKEIREDPSLKAKWTRAYSSAALQDEIEKMDRFMKTILAFSNPLRG